MARSLLLAKSIAPTTDAQDKPPDRIIGRRNGLFLTVVGRFHFFDHIAQWAWRSLASNGVERYNYSHDITPWPRDACYAKRRIDSSKIVVLIEDTRLMARRPRVPYGNGSAHRRFLFPGEPSRRGKPAHAASIRRHCATLTLALRSPSLPLGAPSLHLGAPRRRASIQNRGPRRTTF